MPKLELVLEMQAFKILNSAHYKPSASGTLGLIFNGKNTVEILKKLCKIHFDSKNYFQWDT